MSGLHVLRFCYFSTFFSVWFNLFLWNNLVPEVFHLKWKTPSGNRGGIDTSGNRPCPYLTLTVYLNFYLDCILPDTYSIHLKIFKIIFVKELHWIINWKGWDQACSYFIIPWWWVSQLETRKSVNWFWLRSMMRFLVWIVVASFFSFLFSFWINQLEAEGNNMP